MAQADARACSLHPHNINAIKLTPHTYNALFHRSANLFVQWLRFGKEKPMGNVTHVWYRHEFQPDVGNLSHIHMLVWTTEQMARGNPSTYFSDASRAQTRVTADIRTAFDHISDPILREQWIALASEYQRHTCTSKCKNENGTCRYKCPFPTQDSISYADMQFPVPEGLHDLLVSAGLASRSADNKLVPCPELMGGKWSPLRGAGNEDVSPFIGYIFQLTGSHSNTQVPIPHGWLLPPPPPTINRHLSRNPPQTTSCPQYNYQQLSLCTLRYATHVSV